MTKKDYELICKALAEACISGRFVDTICDALKNDNPRFDKDRFIKHLDNLIEKGLK